MGERSFLAGLVGSGVGPSLTPELHEREGKRQGLRYLYKVFDLPPEQATTDQLAPLLEAARLMQYDGLNVTHPAKQSVVSLLDELDHDAERIGAVNTVLFRNGRMRGHNTDVSGFAAGVRHVLPGVDLSRVVLMGAGGAGTAVAHALCHLGVGELTVFDPDRVRVRRLLESVGSVARDAPRALGEPERLEHEVARASGLVNATPVGMAAHPGTPVPVDLLHPELWVADIVYRPLVTELMKAAHARGCRSMTGAAMAVYQAADAFHLITGHKPDTASMFRDFDLLTAQEQLTSPRGEELP